jgi:ribosome-binding factor A
VLHAGEGRAEALIESGKLKVKSGRFISAFAFRVPFFAFNFPMKHRLQRVNEVIKRELGEIIPREITFEATLVTIQSVDISPDLKNAFVYVSAIGSGAEKKSVVAKLEEHRQALQRELSKRVILKYTPQLHFKMDDSIERGDRIMEILEKIELPPDNDEQE